MASDDESITLSDAENILAKERQSDSSDSESEGLDLIPHQRLLINNVEALDACTTRITYANESKMPFNELQSVTYVNDINIPSIEDDLQRELEFYKQALYAAEEAYKSLSSEKIPITRPADYFAEMMKSDNHMEKIKSQLIKEASAKKASEEAKKQRMLRKFGKKVQIQKTLDRQKEKSQTLEKISNMKRKRQMDGASALKDDHDDVDFDISLDANAQSQSKSKMTREARNSKYGFGGKKRFKKSNDLQSTLSDKSDKKGKFKAKSRPGKNRRLNKR